MVVAVGEAQLGILRTQMLCEIRFLVLAVVREENAEGDDEGPVHEVLKDSESRQAQLHFIVELSHHGHLAAEAGGVVETPIALALFRAAAAIMFVFAVLERAHFHFFFVHALVAEHGVEWRHRHHLHGEGEHHEDDENTANRQRLRQSFPSLDLVHLVREKVDPDFHDAEENANDAVERHQHEEEDVEEHFDVDDVVML